MNEKPHKLDMGFGEALARLVKVPRGVAVGTKTNGKAVSSPKNAMAKPALGKKTKKR